MVVVNRGITKIDSKKLINTYYKWQNKKESIKLCKRILFVVYCYMEPKFCLGRTSFYLC